MNLKFNKDNKLEFDIIEFFDGIPDETKLELVESLASEEAIIKHVTDQILDGWTENMYCGATSFDHDPEPRWSLDYARREIAKRSNGVAKQQIEELERTIERKNKELQKFREKEWLKTRMEKVDLFLA